MLSLVLTHPGGAHTDEFLACCLLLADNEVAVLRAEPTPEQLSDKTVAVVDVGGEWEPERMNFDHHQFPRDSEPLCALSLVLKHLGLYEDALEFCDWLPVAEYIDTRGIIATSRWLNVDRETVSKLNSPIHVGMIRQFAQKSRHEPGEPIWELMRCLGSDLQYFLKAMRSRLEFLEGVVQLTELSNGQKVVFLPRTEPLPEEPSSGIGRFIERKGWKKEIVGMIYPDRRGDGYGISRFDDHPRMDLSGLSEQPDVHFAHKSGFVAKTSATELPRLLELLEMGWQEE